MPEPHEAAMAAEDATPAPDACVVGGDDATPPSAGEPHEAVMAAEDAAPAPGASIAGGDDAMPLTEGEAREAAIVAEAAAPAPGASIVGGDDATPRIAGELSDAAAAVRAAEPPAEADAVLPAEVDPSPPAEAEAALSAATNAAPPAAMYAAPPAATDPASEAALASGTSAGSDHLVPIEAAPPDPALFAHALRIAEALVFASDRPIAPAKLQQALPPGIDARAVLTALAAHCADRPVQLVEVAGGFAFRTATELAPALTRVVEVPRRLPRAAMETLAIIAYHQPVTRAEVEEIRGASLSQTTLEALLEMGLIGPRGRKEVPGRPSLWGTTPRFLEQFGLRALADLPRREELVNEPGPLLAPPPAEAAAQA